MPSLAITGLIGSGKSEVLESLGRALGATIFSADRENSRLLDGDAAVKGEILNRLGDSCYSPDGSANREFLRELIATNETARRTLEGILHPMIQAIWEPLAASFSNRETGWFLAEIPLLYEKDLAHYFNAVIVVACDAGVRSSRLATRRSMNAGDASRWMSLQRSQEEKVTKADHLVWNDGSPQSLTLQIARLAATLLG